MVFNQTDSYLFVAGTGADILLRNNQFNGADAFFNISRPGTNTLLIEDTTFTNHIEEPGDNGGPALTVYAHNEATIDLDVVDSVFDSNFGTEASHVHLKTWPFETLDSRPDVDATFTRTKFWRGGWGVGPVPHWEWSRDSRARQGAALNIDGRDRFLNLTWDEVDFGTGPTANYGRTINSCAEPLEGLVSATYSWPIAPSCPW